jgi:rhamnopyranosyl-N-acetylglucosaminyl-diphospho-decaprenol beta-1,3/1,4-galactofuranosyltransferase
MNPTVVCIIVTYNRLDILKDNLACIFSQNYLPDQILVVNNGSSDGTEGFLKSNEFSHDFITLVENLGYGAGLHAGIKNALDRWNPAYFWLMDDDSFPSPSVLSSLYESFLKHNRHGILGLTGFNMKSGIPRPISSNQSIVESDFVLVDNALVSADAIKQAGNFGQHFFMMCEDFEFCLRLRKHGFFVGVLNSESARVDRKHLGSQANTHNLIWRGYYHSRNHLLIVKEYLSVSSFIFYFFRQAKYLVHSSLFGKNKWLRTKFRLLGILDGIKNIKGKSIDPITLKRVN